jgi:signal transduction histidine kinase
MTTTPKGLINNRYEIRETLWTGGMGNVYRVFDRQQQKTLALKVLEGDHPVAPTRLHRFKVEFRRTPDLVPEGAWEIYDLGLDERGMLFMTLECRLEKATVGASEALYDRVLWTEALSGFTVGDEGVLRTILGHLLQLLPLKSAVLRVLNPEGRSVLTVGNGTSLRDTELVSLDRAMVERETIHGRHATGEWVAAYLGSHDGPLGVLYLACQGALPLSVLTELTSDFSLALVREQRYRLAQEAMQHLEMLNDLSRTVSGTLDRDTILNLVLSQALTVSQADQGAVFWGSERLATLDRSGHSVDDLRVSQSVIAQVLEEGRSLSILDTLEDERFAMQASIMDLQLRAIMCVPLRAGDEIKGVLYVSSQTVARTFGPHDLEVLEGIAGQVALALDNAQSYQTIRELNAGLEDKVAQRTAELQMALKQLQDTQAQLVQAEKMSGLGQMVAGVAHELNNPLNFIFGNLKVLRDYCNGLFGLVGAYERKGIADAEITRIKNEIDYDYLRDDVAKTIESCLKGTTRSQKIVADLKVFAGHDEAELKPVDLKEGINSTVAMVAGRFEGVVTYDLNLADAPLLHGYGKQLNQLFLALFTNAGQAIVDRKRQTPYFDTGIVTVGLTVINEHAVITVRDNGVGIPEEQLGKVFDPFFTTRAVGEGTGLGLTTSYTVVERHRGRIRVESTPGGGSTFTVELPYASPDFREATAEIK